MGGGLMQLVAYGAQDQYLSGNPQITFFKVVYRRHTNFSVEPIQQTWNGAGDFSRTVTCNINRNGDLITNMYLVVNLKPQTKDNGTAWGYVKRLGHALIQETKIEIGGSKIDEQYGDWLNIWYELTHKAGQVYGYNKLIGNISELTNISNKAKMGYTLYIPFIYWFNRNNGLALPLIALQYHDVRITVQYLDFNSCINYVGMVSPNTNDYQLMGDNYLLIDYVYLDSEERKRFAQASHEYLIEQIQFTGSEALTNTSNKFRLNFNHPCKYLIWTPKLSKFNSNNAWVTYASDGNWANACDMFAKLLFIITRKGLTLTTTGFQIEQALGQGGEASIPAAAGDLIDGVRLVNIGVSGQLYNLLNKISVKLISQAAASAQATPSATEMVTITTQSILGSGTGQVLISTTPVADNITYTLVNDLLNNCIVINNQLTVSDISVLVSEILTFDSNMLKTQSTTPIKIIEQILRVVQYNIVDYTNYGNYIDGSDNPCVYAKLQLNGHDRFQGRDGHYFNYVQPWQHFSNTPADGINVYSFALKPEDHQPSGTCNFSRIDNATLQIDCGTNNISNSNYSVGTGSNINIYTVNYNILRVMSGMAGAAYSN